MSRVVKIIKKIGKKLEKNLKNMQNGCKLHTDVRRMIMALLQVRNFPDEDYSFLAEIAKLQNRSITQQTVYMLHKSIMEERENLKINRKKAVNSALMVAENTPSYGKIPSAVDLIREDRER